MQEGCGRDPVPSCFLLEKLHALSQIDYNEEEKAMKDARCHVSACMIASLKEL